MHWCTGACTWFTGACTWFTGACTWFTGAPGALVHWFTLVHGALVHWCTWFTWFTWCTGSPGACMLSVMLNLCTWSVHGCYGQVDLLSLWSQTSYQGQMRCYSKTSNNRPSEKRTTSVQRTAHLPPIDFAIELIHFESPRSGHLLTPNNRH